MFETVFINAYGDKAKRIVLPTWRTEYQRYLAARCDAHVTEYLRRIV